MAELPSSLPIAMAAAVAAAHGDGDCDTTPLSTTPPVVLDADVFKLPDTVKPLLDVQSLVQQLSGDAAASLSRGTGLSGLGLGSFAGSGLVPATSAPTASASGATGSSDAVAEPINLPDINVKPLVHLAEVPEETGEDEEDVIFRSRAKLFRWGEGNAGLQWKDRGVGEVKLLQHKATQMTRLLMRRDKILKVCANHQLSDEMVLETNFGCERSWVYKVLCDFANEIPTRETLAIRFKDKEEAQRFRTAFEAARESNHSRREEDGVSQDPLAAHPDASNEAGTAQEAAASAATDSAATDSAAADVAVDGAAEALQELNVASP